MREYISVTDTAKMIRQALKTQFPGVKFSVKSDKYSGGASIDVSWTDGPDREAVELVAKRYEGADFDGMQDLKTYKTSQVDGKDVHFGADFVFCNRHFSKEYEMIAAQQVIQYWGLALGAEEFVTLFNNGNLWHLSQEWTGDGQTLNHTMFDALEHRISVDAVDATETVDAVDFPVTLPQPEPVDSLVDDSAARVERRIDRVAIIRPR